MKTKYDYKQNIQIIIKNKLNSEINYSLIDISKGKKKNINQIMKIEYLKKKIRPKYLEKVSLKIIDLNAK